MNKGNICLLGYLDSILRGILFDIVMLLCLNSMMIGMRNMLSMWLYNLHKALCRLCMI